MQVRVHASHACSCFTVAYEKDSPIEEKIRTLNEQLQALLSVPEEGTVLCVVGCPDIAPAAALRRRMLSDGGGAEELAEAVARCREALVFLGTA